MVVCATAVPDPTARGFAFLDGSLWLLCQDKNKVDGVLVHAIRVYDPKTFKEDKCFPVPGLEVTDNTGMVPCSAHHCLYISDTTNSRVHRVKLNEEPRMWPLHNDEKPYSISVTSQNSVLVICDTGCKFAEYKVDGNDLFQWMRDIVIEDSVGFGKILHAVETSLYNQTEQFFVAHEGGNLLSIVDASGHVVKEYGSGNGLYRPRHLIVDRDDFLLVVDVGGGVNEHDRNAAPPQLAVVDAELDPTSLKLVKSQNGRFGRPIRVCLDVNGRLLYVTYGDANGKMRLEILQFGPSVVPLCASNN